jgi:hypothetical protein
LGSFWQKQRKLHFSWNHRDFVSPECTVYCSHGENLTPLVHAACCLVDCTASTPKMGHIFRVTFSRCIQYVQMRYLQDTPRIGGSGTAPRHAIHASTQAEHHSPALLWLLYGACNDGVLVLESYKSGNSHSELQEIIILQCTFTVPM